jgi:8-oxo-dGTP diphosphatase
MTAPEPRFLVAVDVVALTITDGILQVAAVQRGQPDETTACIDERRDGRVTEVPRQPNHWALPGGQVKADLEGLEAAARRELREETGIEVAESDLLQIGAYGDLGRDPRSARTVSVAFLAFQPSFGVPRAGSDAHRARFLPVLDLLAAPNRLEFDHERILLDGIQRVRDLMLTTPVATNFCAEQFTITELREVYEVLWHEAYDLETSPAERLKWATEIRGWSSSDEVRLLNQIGFSSRGAALREAAPAAIYQSLAFSSPRMTYQLARMDDEDLQKVTRVMLRAARKKAPRRPVLRKHLDPSNFFRKVWDIPGFITPVPSARRQTGGEEGAGRPARLYRAGPAVRLDPPLRLTVKKPRPTGESPRRRPSP